MEGGRDRWREGGIDGGRGAGREGRMNRWREGRIDGGKEG